MYWKEKCWSWQGERCNRFTRNWKTTYQEQIHLDFEITFPFGTKSQEVCSFQTLLWSLLNYLSLTLKCSFYSHKSPHGSHWLVQVGKDIVKDVLLNGGFRINIIIKKPREKLLLIPKLTLYKLVSVQSECICMWLE